MLPHGQTTDAFEKSTGVSLQTGLTSSQVDSRHAEFGPNQLREGKKRTLLQRFFAQFMDVMILILILAAIISFAIAVHEGNPREFFEPGLILLIVVLNAAMGVIQESKAEKALDALKSLSAPHARVVRDGQEQIIPAADLVPGDVILLEAGDFVPADARLVRSASLKCEESALTGESVPAEKEAVAEVAEDAPLGDRLNMVFSGTSVTYGTAAGIVTGTGMNTEMGKIAGLLDDAQSSRTPLQERLASLGKILGILALAACAVVFLIGVLDGIPILEIFMISVSLAVSAIPEGLPAIVTIVLSIGVQRMVKQNAIIRRLPAVETLGSASVICSDKTGTLTQNKMTLVRAYVDGAEDLEEITSQNSPDVQKLLSYAALCSNASVVFEGGQEKHLGDPTETALVLAAHRNGLEKEALNREYPRVAELPFDSDRKLMSTVHQVQGRYLVVVKGAFDVLDDRCRQGGIEAAREVSEQMSREALRVLAVAYKWMDEFQSPPTAQELEHGLTLMGLVGMIDPPRPEAREAVALCVKAGIKPVMITGDHVVTASAIAADLGILRPGDRAITGRELDEMSEDVLDASVRGISVYARVSPENKIRIVRAWQRAGQVVAMTGDGVNDAPALKAADIGCAMGITGTDVAKGAADMTLTDDNFATIVEAVREGRSIYANIRKVVGFLLGTNIGEVITVFAAMLLFRESPLLSMQLLWINLVTDSMPAIALGMEAAEDGVMAQKPKPKNESIFANGLGVRVPLQGLLFAALTLFGYHIGKSTLGSVTGGQTMAFMILSLTQIVQAFNMRSHLSLFAIGPFSNRTLNLAALASVLLVALVLFTPVSVAFQLVALPAHLYLIGLGLAFVPLPVMEAAKALGLVKP